MKRRLIITKKSSQRRKKKPTKGKREAKHDSLYDAQINIRSGIPPTHERGHFRRMPGWHIIVLLAVLDQ